MDRLNDRARSDLEKAKGRGDRVATVEYAKQILRGQKTKERFLINKAKVTAMSNAIDNQFGSSSSTCPGD